MGKLKIFKIYGLLSLLLISTNVLWSQVAPSPSGIKFSNYQNQMSGATAADYIHFVLNKNHPPGWKVTVTANGNFVNQSRPNVYVAPQHVLLQFSNVSNNNFTPANTTPIPLGTSEIVLMAGMPALSSVLSYDYDFIVQGGDHLLLPNGIYTNTLTIRLYEANGQFVPPALNLNVSFEIAIPGTSSGNTFSLELQNMTNNAVKFNIATESDYANGHSISINDGIKAYIQRGFFTSYNGYQILVHTQTDYLISGSTSATIPVSTFRLEASGRPGATHNTIALSSSAAPLIKNTEPVGWFLGGSETHLYDLRYFIPASQTANLLRPAGTYTTQVYFTMLPY